MGKRKRKVEDMEETTSASAQSLYEILGVEKTASQAEIKKAYHKLALRLHPDKNPGNKDANEKFQSLQNVMSILGDPEKRAVYDETGIVEHAELVGEQGASLAEYMRSFFKKVTEEDIEAFAASYIGSAEETEDLKKLYTRCKGNMDKVFNMLMCSDPVRDSHRFMEVISTAIASGELEETTAFRKWAKAVAKKPAPAADPLARPKKKNGKNDPSPDLLKAIQLRGKDRMDSLFSQLERKYANNTAESEEPTEEEFEAAKQRIQERSQRRKNRK